MLDFEEHQNSESEEGDIHTENITREDAKSLQRKIKEDRVEEVAYAGFPVPISNLKYATLNGIYEKYEGYVSGIFKTKNWIFVCICDKEDVSNNILSYKTPMRSKPYPDGYVIDPGNNWYDVKESFDPIHPEYIMSREIVSLLSESVEIGECEVFKLNENKLEKIRIRSVSDKEIKDIKNTAEWIGKKRLSGPTDSLDDGIVFEDPRE
jgi:hypothetical protein